MPKLQRDAPDQAPERSDPTSAMTASGKRSVAAGRDITAPVFLGDIRDSVIKIYTSLSLLPRVVLLAILLIAALTLGGVALLVLEDRALVSPTPPDPNQFEAVRSPDPNWAITALAVPDGADQAELWIGAQSGVQHALYRLDTTQQADAMPQYVLDVDEQIIDLAVDCKGNVWALLSDIGTLVYQPQTGQHSTLLNRTTTDDWLVKHTTYAIATRCADDGTVEVWLGREGVHTLRYRGDYPSMDTIEFVPWEEDSIFEASRELSGVRALHYAAKSETLWAASIRGQLLSFSLKGVLMPWVTDERDSLWSLSQSPDGVIWAGGSRHLIRVGDEKQAIGLAQDDGTSLGIGAFVIAADQRWVWFGGVCTDSDADCCPLGVYTQGFLSGVDLGARKEVRDIAIDPTGRVWIGTEAGLILYPASER